MIKKIIYALLLAILLVAYFVYINIQTLKKPPEFSIKNNTDLSISFTANWRDSQLAFDNLKSKGTMTFTIRDEASMKFIIEYESGKKEEQGIGYFTGGDSCFIEVNESNAVVTGCFSFSPKPNKSKHADL